MTRRPQKIACITEESVEFLYDIGREDLICGVSSFVERPVEAKKLPTLSAFTHANIKKILNVRPDLIIGFSDIQKDIARDLIGAGLNVFISNHRSLDETLDYLRMLARIVGEEKRGEDVIKKYESSLMTYKDHGQKRKRRPRVYLEEWDSPLIRGIEWFSECVEVCGGVDVFKSRGPGALAKERFVAPEDIVEANPDIILASWCGKPVDMNSFSGREGWENISAVKNNCILELPSAIILQPGPALFKDALPLISDYFDQWEERYK